MMMPWGFGGWWGRWTPVRVQRWKGDRESKKERWPLFEKTSDITLRQTEKARHPLRFLGKQSSVPSCQGFGFQGT